MLELIGKVVGGRSEWQGARGHSSAERGQEEREVGRKRQCCVSGAWGWGSGQSGRGGREVSGTEIGTGIVSGRAEAHFRCLLGWGVGPAGREAAWMGLGLKGSCPKLCFTSTTAHLHETISPWGGRGGHK